MVVLGLTLLLIGKDAEAEKDFEKLRALDRNLTPQFEQMMREIKARRLNQNK